MGQCRAELVLWVRKQTGDAVTTITSKDEAEAFLSKNVTAAIGFFAKLEVGLLIQLVVLYSLLLRPGFRVSLSFQKLALMLHDLYVKQGPEHAAFVAAAQADNGVEFVQTTAPEVAEVLLSPSVEAPSMALRKQEPEQYTPFGMKTFIVIWSSFS